LDGQGDRQVGDDAHDQCETDPAGIVIGLKKEIHRLGKKHFGPGRSSVERVGLASDLFRMIHTVCCEEVFHADIHRCVVTVPVTFEEQKRACIGEAARLGGFTDVQLIEEPVSAAQAWFAQSGQKFGEHVIVCDVGGGTTDLVLLRYVRGRFEQVPEVPTAGFALGGNDVDETIFDHLLSLQDAQIDQNLAMSQKAPILIKLRRVRELMLRDRRQDYQVAVGPATMQVPRAVLEQCISEFVDRVDDDTRRFMARCQQAASLKEIPLLLVGGGSRMPGLKESLEKLAPGMVLHWNQSDYATVLGAVEQPLSKPQDPHPEPDPSKRSPDPGPLTEGDIREMIADGNCERAFDIVSKTLVTNPSEKLFQLWIQVASIVPDGLSVLSWARKIHRLRNRDMWSSAALAMALADLNRRDEAAALLGPPPGFDDAQCFPLSMSWLAVLSQDKTDERYRRLVEALTKMKPNNPLLLLYASEIMTPDDPQREGEMIDRALQIDAHLPYGLLLRALSLGAAPDDHKIAALISTLDVMDRIAPGHFIAHVLRVFYRQLLDDFQGAKSESIIVLKDPRLAANRDLMECMLAQNVEIDIALQDVPAALTDIEEAVRSFPHSGHFLFLRGEILKEQKDFRNALASFNQGLELSPNSPRGLFGRGSVRSHLGDFAEASRDFESAATVDPDPASAVFLATWTTIRDVLSQVPAETSQLHGSLFIYPDIPDEKVSSAKTKLGHFTNDDKTILLLYDASSFGTMDLGFYVTEDFLLWTAGVSETKPNTCKLSSVQETRVSSKGIHVNSIITPLPMEDGIIWDGTQMRATICSLLDRLAETHRRLSHN
jgi:actin-like ATPase involved in cell morphogenesis/tetratricopeptide (TPR) repeat protein